MAQEPTVLPLRTAARSGPGRRDVLTGGLAALAAGLAAGGAAAQTAPAPNAPLPITPPAPPPAATPSAPAAPAERSFGFTLDDGRCEALVVPGPAGARLPGILLVPELTGLAPQHVRLAHRLAGLGYVVLVPNFISVFGSTEDRSARTKIATLSPARTTHFLRAALGQLASQPTCSGALAVVALGWGGGGIAGLAADPGAVKAIVAVHTALPAELLHAVKVPLQLHYAGQDEKMQPQIDAAERRLIGHSRVYEQFVYEGAGPGFLNELDEKRYNEKAASLLLGRVEFFLAKALRAR